MTEAKGGDIRSAADVLSCFPTLISFFGDLHQKIACADLSISMQVTEVAEACLQAKRKKVPLPGGGLQGLKLPHGIECMLHRSGCIVTGKVK